MSALGTVVVTFLLVRTGPPESWASPVTLPLPVFDVAVPAWTVVAFWAWAGAELTLIETGRALTSRPALVLTDDGLTITEVRPSRWFFGFRWERRFIPWRLVSAVFDSGRYGLGIELRPEWLEGASLVDRVHAAVRRRPPTVRMPLGVVEGSHRIVRVAREIGTPRGAGGLPSAPKLTVWRWLTGLTVGEVVTVALLASTGYAWNEWRGREPGRLSEDDYLRSVAAHLHADTALLTEVGGRIEAASVALDRLEGALVGEEPIVDTTAFIEDLLRACDLSWRFPTIETGDYFDLSDEARDTGARLHGLGYLLQRYHFAVRAVDDRNPDDEQMEYHRATSTILPHDIDHEGPTVRIGVAPHTARSIVSAAMASDLKTRIPSRREALGELARTRGIVRSYSLHALRVTDSLIAARR